MALTRDFLDGFCGEACKSSTGGAITTLDGLLVIGKEFGHRLAAWDGKDGVCN